MYKFFTSESVCAGHPDKICDQISDAILDAVLSQDPYSKTAIETVVKDRVIIVGEINTNAKINFEKIARREVKKLGYERPEWGFSYKSPVEIHVNHQSSEIAQGVGEDEGAGDQGMMFGYACDETKTLMPLPITLAHALTKAIDNARETKKIPYLRPDGKSEVTIRYENGIPVGIEKVVIAVPHDEDVSLKQLTKDTYRGIVLPTVKKYGFALDESQLIVNGTGIWHLPGPSADSGLTGRKIVVDGYGGYARVGGGAFSGKDPSKVDRSGAYAARYLAKNIVSNGLARKAEVALAYCIGQPRPFMQTIETFETERIPIDKIEQIANQLLDTSVGGIIKALRLRRPIYKQTAVYGHFGKADLPWEQVKNLKI